MSPSATETVEALGAAACLVGVDTYSKPSAAAPNLTRVGSFLEPDLEAILRLAPTVVIVDDVQTKLIPTFQGAKIDVVRCPMHALIDVRQCITAIGERLGLQAAAAKQLAVIDAALAGARLPQSPSLRVLAIIDHAKGTLENVVAAGPGSWMDELLRTIGAANALGDATKRYVPLGAEELIAAAPDVIVDVTVEIDRAAIEAKFKALPFTHPPVVVFLQDQALSAPSPRIAEALQELRAALAPIAPTIE